MDELALIDGPRKLAALIVSTCIHSAILRQEQRVRVTRRNLAYLVFYVNCCWFEP